MPNTYRFASLPPVVWAAGQWKALRALRIGAAAYGLIVRMDARAPRRATIALLKGLIGLTSRLTGGYRVQTLYKLMVDLMLERRYQEALDTSDLMAREPLAGRIAAEVKRRRAECLEALGRHDEAKREIAEAWAAVEGSQKDRVTLSAQAALLSREGRDREAYEAYKQLLAITPAEARAERDSVLAFLMSKAILAGENDAQLPWAQQLLSESVAPNYRCMAYLMAATGAFNTREMDLAEQYAREGIACAESAKLPDETAKIQAYLASILAKRPDPLGALTLLDKIIAAHPGQTRSAWTSKAELLYMMGRFEDGIEAAERAIAANPGVMPSGEQMHVALLKLIVARGHAMLGDASKSRRLISESASVFTEGKLSLWCEAMALYCTALDGDGEATRVGAGKILEKMKAYPESNDLRQACYSNIARAAWKLGDWEACAWSAGEYQELYLAPSEKTMPLFLLGEATRGMGDEAKARGWYEQAAGVHPEIYWSKLAARALGGKVAVTPDGLDPGVALG